ncbi:MAG TPA: TraR/DksA C4-type zinc finger protein [Rariglobus sp.]|jgi:RNA polymerase-binding transcription factor DksA|nr:TraR/DksA C4-type zinc finger protein [Rariglobus sp.]
MAKKQKKPAPAPKKKPARKPAKPVPKKSPKKSVKPSKPVAKKSATKAKPSPKAKPAAKAKAKAPAAKPSPKAVAPAKPAKSSAKSVPPSISVLKAVIPTKSSARADLRSKILAKSKTKEKIRPISFSFDEIREIAKTTSKHDAEAKAAAAKTAAKSSKHISAEKLAKHSQPHHIKAASLADILGFNPKKAKQPSAEDESVIPEKFRRYYRLLLDLRNHLTGQIDTHSEETLKRSAKDDAGDLSSYGQHMADAGTDTFDRDFALSLVSSEQEALSEVEAAIKRVKAGTYGLCEITQKPIAKERLLAVPFTRYSAEAQKDIEKNRHRSRTQAGLFGELGEEGGTLSAGGSGDDDGGE